MLHIQNLEIIHQKDLQSLIKGLSLHLHPGDKLAIIGEEGTGKSTLIQAIAAPAIVQEYAEIKGNITNHFHHIGYLPQSLPEKISQQHVSDFLYHDMDYTRFDFGIFYRYAEEFSLSIQNIEKRNPILSSLSGGEKIKLQLLKLLAYNPDCLIFDEPTSDLDLETVAWLEHFIKKSDKAVLFISHDETLLANTATAILHLELVKKRQEPRWTYFQGNYAEYISKRKEHFSKQLHLANKEREEHKKRMTENNRIQQRVEHQLRNTKNATVGQVLAKKMRALKSQERRFERESQNFTEIPKNMDAIHLFFSDIVPAPATKVILHFEKERLATNQLIDLTVRGRDKIVITGKNGIGKTRFLQKIYQSLTGRTDLSLAYMPQNYAHYLPNDCSALSFLSNKKDEETVRTFLASLQFTREEIHHSLADLSGGQKAKIFLAKMVLEKNNVLLLDEPTRHFSPTSQPLIRQLLSDFPGCIISVSHNREYINSIAHTIYILDENSLTRQSSL